MDFINYLLGGQRGLTATEVAAWEREQMRRMQIDSAARTMGGFGGAMLARLQAGYGITETSDHILKEGLMNVNVIFTQIDKKHVLVEVGCIKRIAHDKKELRNLAAELIEKHAEQYLWGEQPKSSEGPREFTSKPGASSDETKT